MADESRGANTKHRVKQWALIRTESNTLFWTCSHTKQFWKDFTDSCSRNIRDTTLILNDVLYGVEDGTICNLIFTVKTFVYNRRIHEDIMRFEGFINAGPG